MTASGEFETGDANRHSGTATGTTDSTDDVLLKVDGLSKHFPVESGLFSGLNVSWDGRVPSVGYGREYLKAVDDVSFEIRRGETLGLVGESGCGKSTLARTILRLLEPSSGSIEFEGRDITTLGGEDLRQQRRNMQMVFQDPQSSLNPRQKIGQIVEEPLKTHGLLDDEGRETRARELLERVGLDSDHYNRYPHEFSGGQRQRVNLARALALDPDLIICDEPVASLDVSIQAQVLNTMTELQEEFGLTYLFIAHDLSVIRQISDRVAVMYLGKIVELGNKEAVYENPKHPYTKALLDSIPVPDPRKRSERETLGGDLPSPVNPPSGCRFRTRCPELIAPDAYDFSDAEWAALRELIRTIDRQLVEPSPPEALRRQFLNDVDLPAAADESVERALELFADGEPDRAAELLSESFVAPSVCARDVPSYEVDSTNGTEARFVACHRYAEETPTE
ncbi:ATP-binding cassette domain-containing protein [Natronorubrum sp. JWXQ-INN-674]|uniref:ATP-binding cassette domain-containing protein n=1 Tax=Natronorubrum halalkaliphilum TaxID=2691917 RepID=A0A6B0VFI5_9EURY|nr:ABC transporter ATP-binding protein [Natronorubrum halalkaliphilum]MXV60531.1 ATP-binding cassette domain-containing protein [Natronorubrum halalkaliphilum]